VRRSATLIGIAVLSLLGSEGGDEATSVERKTRTTVVVAPGPPNKEVLTPEKRLSQWIVSCEVREITFTHESTAVAYVSASVMEKDGVSDSAMRSPPTRCLQRRHSSVAPTSGSPSIE
jgi:hypothetical protein